VFLLHDGSAWKAMAIYFGAHLLSSGLVLLVLYRKDHIPNGMVRIYFVASLAGAALAALAWLRTAYPSQTWSITGSMSALFLAVTWGMLAAGRRHGWVPSGTSLRQFISARVDWMRQSAGRTGGNRGE
jgi:hypothetical protein